MSSKCVITGKKPMTGNHVSHAQNKKKRRFCPNLQTKRIWVPELNKFVKLRLTTKALRIIDKKGIGAVLGVEHTAKKAKD